METQGSLEFIHRKVWIRRNGK